MCINSCLCENDVQAHRNTMEQLGVKATRYHKTLYPKLVSEPKFLVYYHGFTQCWNFLKALAWTPFHAMTGKLLTVQELVVPSDQPRRLRSDGMGITPLHIYIYNYLWYVWCMCMHVSAYIIRMTYVLNRIIDERAYSPFLRYNRWHIIYTYAYALPILWYIYIHIIIYIAYVYIFINIHAQIICI